MQFAREGGLGRFAGLVLAAREFPQARQIASFGAARQQDAATSVADDAGDDFDVIAALASRGRFGLGGIFQQERPSPQPSPALRERGLEPGCGWFSGFRKGRALRTRWRAVQARDGPLLPWRGR